MRDAMVPVVVSCESENAVASGDVLLDASAFTSEAMFVVSDPPVGGEILSVRCGDAVVPGFPRPFTSTMTRIEFEAYCRKGQQIFVDARMPVVGKVHINFLGQMVE